MGWGGQEIRTLTEAQGFIGRGHRVVVYAAPGARIGSEASRFGVPVITLPIGRKRLHGISSLARTLADNPVDVVNAHSSTDAWLAALACEWLRRKRRRVLCISKRIDRIRQDLGVGEQPLANNLAAKDVRHGEEEECRSDRGADDSADQRRSDPPLSRRRRHRFAHLVSSFWSLYFLSFLASSARDTMAMSCARR